MRLATRLHLLRRCSHLPSRRNYLRLRYRTPWLRLQQNRDRLAENAVSAGSAGIVVNIWTQLRRNSLRFLEDLLLADDEGDITMIDLDLDIDLVGIMRHGIRSISCFVYHGFGQDVCERRFFDALRLVCFSLFSSQFVSHLMIYTSMTKERVLINCSDLTLSMTHKVNTREMSIMLIMVILFATIFFFHGLVRLCILVIKSNREAAMRANRPPRYRGPPRYAVPPVPIPVVLARDEEAVGIESEVTKCQPPAYGRWRETVVCFDPAVVVNLLMLTMCSESTPTVYSGNVTRTLIFLSCDLELSLDPGRLLTCPRMAFLTWSRRLLDQLRLRLTCHSHRILQKWDE